MTLIAAKHLKEIFDVNAKFYHTVVNGEKFLMRREARITRKGSGQGKIDAVVVMINPGSCKPSAVLKETSSDKMEMVPANPDQTQYQLMNLMERKNWDVLVILNLSDICEGNLQKFREIEKKFAAAKASHSIFQDENVSARNELLSNSGNLIFAWGTSPVAKKLAKEFGLFNNGTPTKKYNHMKAWVHPEKLFPMHPRPALMTNKVIWLDTMESLLSEGLPS